MVSRLLLGLFAGLCLLVFSEGARFSSCEGDRKYVEGYDDAYLYCYVNSTSTVRWTVVNETGATLHMATCYGEYNCTTPYSSSLYFVHNGPYIRVQFDNISSEFSGLVTCQETLTNGTVLTDTCQVNVARVSFRAIKVFDVRENRTNSTYIIYCYNFQQKPSTVTWSLTTTSGQTLDLGTCTEVGKCTSPHAPDISLQRPYNYRSDLYIQEIDRGKGGELFCSYTYKGLRETANTTLNVYSPATVSNCHAKVHPGNWSTILSCDVSNVFSSAGLYNFRVDEYFEVLEHGILTRADSSAFDGRLSYRDMLTPYTNSTDNKVYYRGRLTYSWPLSTVQGIYTRLTVWVNFGFFISAEADVGYIVNITTPSQPTHNCSELSYIPETGVVPSCVCTTDYLGSPAGRLVWLLGNVTIATGGYGVTQLTFPSGKVSRQHDGMKVTCQLDWVQPMTTELSNHVAYVDNIKLAINMTLRYVLLTVCTRVTENQVETQVHARIVRENQEWHGLCTDSACSNAHVTGTCDSAFSKSITAVVVIEQVPVTVRSNQTQRTSAPQDVLLRAAVEEDAFDLKTIDAILKKTEILVSVLKTCTPGYTYTGTKCVKQEEPSSMSPLLIGSIVGGVLSFLVVVILIVLVVVVYRRFQQADTGRRPSTGREQQDDEHDYSSLTPAGRYTAPDHSGVELGGLDIDLTNPCFDEQNERPVSDYDVIGDENPEIAKYLAESSLAKEQPDYICLREDKEDYITPCSPPESSEDQNDSDHLTPYPPRPNSDGQEREDKEDYITPCSPPESGEDKNDSDYLTPCSVKENLGN